MKHVVEEVEQKIVGNSALAIGVRCCGDDKTLTWHTIQEVHTLTPEQIDEEIEEHKKRVADMHEGVIKASEHVARRRGAAPGRPTGR